MPKDPNYTDDDNLIPDWMRDMAPEPSPDESGGDLFGDVSPFETEAPWDQLRGEVPSRPSPLTPAAPPWEVFEAGEPPPPAVPPAATPWEQMPGPAVEGPGAGETAQADQTFDWEPVPGGASGQPPVDIDYGMTAQLPWRNVDQPAPEEQPEIKPLSSERGRSKEERFTMSELRAEFDQGAPSEPEPPAKAPSLADRLRALSPKRETPPAEPLSTEESDWMSGFGQAAAYDAAMPTSEGGDLDWLGEEEPAQEPARPVSPDEGVPGGGVGSFGEEEPPAEPEEPSLPDWVSPPAEEPPPQRPRGIRRLVPRPKEPSEEPAAPEAAPSPMTYEEWEQSQIEREREAQKTDADRLLEEVPEWFDTLGAQPPAAEEKPSEPTPPGGPEFRPDWYAGLEEQPAEEAPDWFEKLDYSADALAQPFEVPASSEPTSEEPEVPDWFKGAGAPELQGVDWAAAFGAPPGPPSEEPVEAGKPPDWPESTGPEEELPLPDLTELAAFEEEEAALVGPEDEELVFRDLEALGGPEREEIAPGEVPDWLTTTAPASAEIAEPEEIRFPELDLDQAMPTEAAFDLAALQAERPGGAKEPTKPADDFVERFEPLEPDEFRELPAALDEEAPEWLREIADEGATARTPEAPPTSGQAAEELDWLTEISPEDVPHEPAAPSPVEVEEAHAMAPLDSEAIDQLLSLYEPEIPEPEIEEALPEAAEQEPFPEEEEVSEEPPAEEPAFYEVTGVPDTEAAAALDEMSSLRALLSEAGPGEGVPELGSLFDQAGLEEVFGEEEAAGPPGRRAPEAPPQFKEPGPPPEAPTTEGPHPEWVEEMRPSDLPVTVKAGGAEIRIKQKQVVELPERLRAFREEALHELKTEQPAPPAESGPLAGIAGALPAADVMLPRATVKPVEGLVISEEQQKRVQKLQALLDLVAAEEEEAETERAEFEEAERFALEGLEPGAEAAPAPPTKRARRARRFKADRPIIALLLLLALLAPFATDALHFAAEWPALSGERLAVANAVDTLTAGSYVLVALEYSPTASGELDPLAEAVLRDILARGAIPLVLSTNPAGAFHAEAVLAPLVDDQRLLAARATGETSLKAGQDYYLLSYLPGEAVGVRSLRHPSTDRSGNVEPFLIFKTDLRGDETGLNITSLEKDIALILVVGDESGAVRTWAEQLKGVPVPKVALVTAAIEPLTTPYVNKDAYAGYLAGVRDTYSYNAARNTGTTEPYQMPGDLPVELPDPELSRWHSIALGAAVAAGLVALGMVLNLFRALARRGRS